MYEAAKWKILSIINNEVIFTSVLSFGRFVEYSAMIHNPAKSERHLRIQLKIMFWLLL